MKKIIYLFFILSLSSCLKYQEPKLLSLSGEYIIEEIIVQDENFNNEISHYYNGDLFINELVSFPIDSINLGDTKWSFDYSSIYLNPFEYPDGTIIYNDQYYYRTFGQNYFDDLGYIDIFIDNNCLTFKIINDGTESLQLRNKTEFYVNGVITKVNITYYLTRIGP